MKTTEVTATYQALFEKQMMRMFDDSQKQMLLTAPKTNPFLAARMKASFERSANALGMRRYLGAAYRPKWVRYEPIRFNNTCLETQ